MSEATAELAIERTLPGCRVLFSTRRGGVSEGPYRSLNLGILTDDDPDRVARNRAILAGRAGLAPAAVAMGWQVHGAEIKEWDTPPAGDGFAASRRTHDLARVDGHATERPGIGLLVLVADCVPLALAAPGRLAMLHCGWRGLAAGIVERALATFAQPPPAAVIGPGIGPCCYTVGPEVAERFRDAVGVVRDGRLDLKAVIERKLAAGGVTAVDDVGLCTSCDPTLFFSHRRDGGVTGRQAGLAWLE